NCVVGSTAYGQVRALAIDLEGRSLVACDFKSFNGVARPGICRVLPGLVKSSPPLITSQPLSQSVVAGEDTILSVSDLGFPYPQYQWLRNGSAVQSATNSSLILKDAQPTDAGAYTVNIRNELGATTSEAAVVNVTTPTQPGSLDLSFVPPPDSDPYDSRLVGRLRSGALVFQRAVRFPLSPTSATRRDFELITLDARGSIERVWPAGGLLLGSPRLGPQALPIFSA